MKRLLPIVVITLLIGGCSPSVNGQSKAERTSSARAAYGNSVEEFRAHKKRNKKTKNKARKKAKRKQSRDKASYFRGRPF